jgi:hypothetical protein
MYVCNLTLFLFRLEDGNCEHPICGCGLHVAFGRTRIGAMNDADRNYKYVSVLCDIRKYMPLPE